MQLQNLRTPGPDETTLQDHVDIVLKTLVPSSIDADRAPDITDGYTGGSRHFITSQHHGIKIPATRTIGPDRLKELKKLQELEAKEQG